MTIARTRAPLAPRDAYALWAGSYERETAVSFLEELTVRDLAVPIGGRRLLDVGCGVARRLQWAGGQPVRPAFAMGVDLTPEMLARARGGASLAAADVRQLPLGPATFDVVWCRLVVGHVPELEQVYLELARVVAPGGFVVVTDFHPDAVAAGHRRTFRDPAGVVREIEHHTHSGERHLCAAGLAGLRLVAHRDGTVGESVRSFYGGRDEAYASQHGLRLVLALAFERSW